MGGARRWLFVGGLTVLAALLVVALQPDGSSSEGQAPPAPLVAEGAGSEAPVAAPPPSTAAPAPPASTTTTASPVVTTATARRPATTATPAPAAPAPNPPGFESSVQEIDSATAERMTASWRPGCPVPLRDLRLVTITHWGFDGRPRPGEVVVRAAHAEGIRRVFAELFAAQFPIEQVRLIDEFGGDDDRSMAANNTSAFNCRPVRGSARWSQHAYGLAIDVNPLQNPWVTSSGTVLPPGGRDYVRRDGSRQGVITARGPVVAAFTRIGWGWGGSWRNPDYQHFSANGR